MQHIVDTVLDKLGPHGLDTIAGKLGLDRADAKRGVTTAVTALTGALAHNASKPEGARSLDSALERDHDGGIFDNLGDYLGDFAAGPGKAILGHVFGSKEPTVEKAVADKSGLPLDKVVPLLTMVAPLVLGALGRRKKEENLDASQMATTLAEERAAAAEKDDGGILDTVMGALGGLTGSGQSSGGGSKGGLGGLLNAIGGLFGGKKKGP
ncbi:MAG TPA: DUF937 domain-containing protein [Acidimicrobiia bacterium]|nr:DUF937 domain-containing protein [Acidimicrobiia bacterium]